MTSAFAMWTTFLTVGRSFNAEFNALQFGVGGVTAMQGYQGCYSLLKSLWTSTTGTDQV